MNGCAGIRPLIVRSVDGDLDPGEALRLARHLTSCTACRIVLARESRLAEMLDGSTETITVDESFFGTVMDSLPERPPRLAMTDSRKGRRWRGLRLAGWGAIAALCGGLAARVLPSVRLDVATPAMPRFAPDDADGLISLLGTAVQCIRMTAQSVAWAGSTEAWGAFTVGAISLSAVLVALATFLTVSSALAWVSRSSSRES